MDCGQVFRIIPALLKSHLVCVCEKKENVTKTPFHIAIIIMVILGNVVDKSYSRSVSLFGS